MRQIKGSGQRWQKVCLHAELVASEKGIELTHQNPNRKELCIAVSLNLAIYGDV